MSIATLAFFRYASVADRLWAFGQMARARGPLRRVPDIGFHKLFGSGSEEGFHPAPNFGVYGIMATWPSAECAEARWRDSAVFRAMRARAAEAAALHLKPVRAWGQWAGAEPFGPQPSETAPPHNGQPFAVLTRATVKLSHVRAFWRRTPAIRRDVRAADAIRFRIGLGESPWTNQVTFSVWSDFEAMRAFAYREGGPHRAAIDAVRRGDWFREELYARFQILSADGAWDGEPFADKLGLETQRAA